MGNDDGDGSAPPEGLGRHAKKIGRLVELLRFHQSEYHKVNGRAVVALLGAAGLVLATALKVEGGVLRRIGEPARLCVPFILVFLGMVCLAGALAVHSFARTNAQRRIEAAINSLLGRRVNGMGVERPFNWTLESSDLFRAQPGGFPVNGLFFAATTFLVVGMVWGAILVGLARAIAEG